MYLIAGIVGAFTVVAFAYYWLSSAAITQIEKTGSAAKTFPIDKEPYGTPYSMWAAKWWQWVMSIPSSEHPILDSTGEKCAVGQNDPNVWFLANTPGGTVSRNCVITESKAILIPLLPGECDDISEEGTNTEAELRDCAWSGIKGAVYNLSVDGVEIPNLESYRTESPLFDLTIPEDNIFGGSPVGETKASAVGIYVILEPLPQGMHTIRFSSSLVDSPALGTFVFAEDVTYNIDVRS